MLEIILIAFSLTFAAGKNVKCHYLKSIRSVSNPSGSSLVRNPTALCAYLFWSCTTSSP
jgi:hypothetical protein